MDKNKNNWLTKFVKEVIDGWMIEDIKNLQGIPSKLGGSGNCNFPIALYLFSCIEFLGQLTPIIPVDSKKPGYSQESITLFIDSYFPDHFKKSMQPYRSNFVNIFRNGMAHSYFSKYAGVGRLEKEPFKVNQDGMLILDADLFANAFFDSIKNLKSALATDSLLGERMVDRYSDMYIKNEQKFRATPTTTMTSFASLPHPSMVSNLSTTTLQPLPLVKKGKIV